MVKPLLLSSDSQYTTTYAKLKRLAVVRLQQLSPRGSWNATALVNEAFLRVTKSLSGSTDLSADSKMFFCAVSEAMRHVIVDYHRSRCRLKRGGKYDRVDLNLDSIPDSNGTADFLELNEALSAFELAHPEHAKLVKLRFFSGMTMPECARALDISLPTAERWWRYARAWLADRLEIIDDQDER